MASKSSALVLMSGGIDSMCCAHFLKERGSTVTALFVDYRQSAVSDEILASKAVCELLGVPLKSICVSHELDLSAGEIRGRNLLLVSLGYFSFSEASSGLIGLGIHDGTLYGDCTAKFIEELNTVLGFLSDGRYQITAPFVNWHKSEVYQYAIQNKLPINATYSCEKGGVMPCGRCLSCQDRRIISDLQKSG